MKILFEDNELEFNELSSPLFTENKISVQIARLDKIHPVVSGNKLYKLHYFLQDSIKQGLKPVITFGGAYSNHLAATAFACKIIGIKSIGIVRGEKPAILSQTLMQCENNGMELHFISRADYQNKDSGGIVAELTGKPGESIVIPEGGYHPIGALGAGLIMNKLRSSQATHICTAIGTATTTAGLLMNASYTETIIGIPVLKGMDDIYDRLEWLTGNRQFNNLTIFDNYHFGGYAKKTNELIEFMNEFYCEHKIPTDFVYTAKMLFAVIDKIKAGYFEEGSRIICLHTGGLQGNVSLPITTLVF